MTNWKPVNGYEGVYEINNKGVVKSLKRKFVKEDRIRLGSINSDGYRHLDLWKDRKYQICTVHRLVANAFLENPNHYKQINHIDGNKLNNNVNNLEWCDGFHNMREAQKLGLLKHPRMNKFNLAMVRSMRKMHEIHGLTTQQIADIFCARWGTVRAIITYKRWKYETK